MDRPAPHPLARLFDPRGVAIIGASEAPGKYGTILLRGLIEHGFKGAIHPVNPKGGALLGRPFLRSLDEAEGPIDVALIVRPAPEVLAAVRGVARRRIPFAIVYAAGFSERGEEGRALEAALVAAAHRGGTRLVGPNCMNIFSAPARLNLSSIPFPPGALGFLSASGNLGFALAHEAAGAHGVGFSRFVSAGNQADLALHDYLDFLRADPGTRVVLVFAEGFVPGGARPFLETLTRTAAEKPVLVLRGGRTPEGQRTAASHTGALAAESEVARQALEQAGAVVLDRADEAVAASRALLASPLPGGPGVALIGEGGGHATLVADAAAEAGLRVDPFPADLTERLRTHLPPFAAILKNPVELGGRSEYDLRTYDRILDEVIGWPGADQVILFGGYALYDETLADRLARLRRETGKPILIHDLYADEERPALDLLHARDLPLFSSVEVAARAASALASGGKARRRARRALAWFEADGRGAAGAERSATGSGRDVAGPGTASPLPEDLAAALARAALRPEKVLLEDEAARFLAHFGLPVLPAALARDEEEAVRAAERLGFPVVLKVHTSRFVHKSDAGGVHLDLRSTDEVRRAFGSLRRLVPRGEVEVRLTPFVRGGVEAIAGARRDPRFGPLLIFGAGGILAEVARDVALRTIPCPDAELEEMVAETRLARLLDAPRSGGPADRQAILAALRSLERLLLSVPGITDAEANPLRCAEDGVMALDARVLVGNG